MAPAMFSRGAFHLARAPFALTVMAHINLSGALDRPGKLSAVLERRGLPPESVRPCGPAKSYRLAAHRFSQRILAGSDPWPGQSVGAIRRLADAGACFWRRGLVAGAWFDLGAMREMRRHRAGVLPHRAATAVVTTGPLALSRNPIYFGNILLLIGAGLLFRNIWLLPVASVSGYAVRALAILPEEAHLAARFGNEWRTYSSRTGRWIGTRS